jgi:predicted HAD superfamily Cof-like phosphohydrolase
MNYINKVQEFHETFNHPINDTLDIDLNTRQLRVKLIFEELEELAIALDVKNTFKQLCEQSISDLTKVDIDSDERIKSYREETQNHITNRDYENAALTRSKEEAYTTYLNDVGILDGGNVDKVETIDALADIQYVLSGGILALGYSSNFDNAFGDVHNSNMTKACKSMDEVNDTIDMYLERGMERTNIDFKEVDDMFIVYRVEDNKVLKNSHYTPANMKQFV